MGELRFPKTAPMIFLKFYMQTGNSLKNSLFLVLTECKVSVTLFWGSEVHENDLFFKKVFKIFENFLVIDFNSASYYLLFRPKLIHFKGP